jgi:hypothetical protein
MLLKPGRHRHCLTCQPTSVQDFDEGGWAYV